MNISINKDTTADLPVLCGCFPLAILCLVVYFVTTQRGGIGRVGGRETQEGRDMGTYVHVQRIHFVIKQKLTHHCKAIILQKRLKKIKIKIKNPQKKMRNTWLEVQGGRSFVEGVGLAGKGWEGCRRRALRGRLWSLKGKILY